MPKVSIIVPVYNVETYVEKCLKSLLEQTLEEIEIIVVNDGSTDNSKEIIQNIVKQFPDKVVYKEKENGGLSDARNYGINYAKGEYIAFFDSDDYVEKDMYEKMYLRAQKEDCDMVECNFFWEYPDHKKEDIGKTYQGKKEMLEKVRVMACNKIIKREILEKTNIRFPKGLRYEDVEFTYKLVPYLEKISLLQEPCFYYVQRENSISNLQNERTKEIFQVLDNVIDYYQQEGLYDTYQTELEYLYARYAFCSSFLRMIKIQDKELRKKLLEETWQKVNEKFPNWKKNQILKTKKSLKHLYMRTLNKVTFKLYSQIFRIL